MNSLGGQIRPDVDMGMIDAGTKTLYEGDSAALAARNPTSGMTRSTRCAAVSAIRRPPQDGHMPRDLQEKATTRSSLQVWQKIRRKLRASTPQSRKDRYRELTITRIRMSTDL